MKGLLFFALLAAALAVKAQYQLPACNGCYMSQGSADYECCSNMRMSNGVCTCSSGPCTQCSPSTNDEQRLPSCGGCAAGFNGTAVACCSELTVAGGECSCNGGACTECNEEKPVAPQSNLPSCPSNCWSQINGAYYTCPGTNCEQSMINNQCYCSSSDQPCEPCSR